MHTFNKIAGTTTGILAFNIMYSTLKSKVGNYDIHSFQDAMKSQCKDSEKNLDKYCTRSCYRSFSFCLTLFCYDHLCEFNIFSKFHDRDTGKVGEISLFAVAAISFLPLILNDVALVLKLISPIVKAIQWGHCPTYELCFQASASI